MITNRESAVLVSGLLCAIILFAGCSSSNKQASSSFDPDTGKHTLGWSSPAAHGTAAKTQANGFAACQECHADDFSGGVSAVSCKSCHTVNAPHAPAPWIGGQWTHTNTNPANASICAQCHTNGSNSTFQPSQAAPAGSAPGCYNNTLCHGAVGHATGWNASDQHGAAAKSAPTYTGGFTTCETCHGSDFSGGLVQTSCFTCHGVNAPHAPKPWDGISTAFTHTTTDAGNAPACAQCHTNGANSSLQPSLPAAAGTAPGCFNNTLCHAQMGHPEGWDSSTQHGAAAKSAPTSTGGFALCETCHGSDFSGGIVLRSCFTCHGVRAPHSPKPWSGLTSSATHTTTSPANASICAQCHANGNNSSLKPSSPAPAGTAPDCFNNTLCHAQMGHPTGWDSPDQHGAAAKAQPTSAGGFALCATCHGSDFSGGVIQTSCFTCHKVNAPHAPKPWSGATATYKHSTTDPGNAPVCAQCHTNGANSSLQPSQLAQAGALPDCFNNTLCHAQVGHPTGWSDPTQHGAAAKSAPTSTSGFTLCETCHGSDFSGGVVQTSCFTCHGGSGPHPTSWITGSYTHTTTDTGNASVCAQCHTNGANSPIAPPSPPAAAGTAPGCFNNTLCHAQMGHPAGWSDPTQHGAAAKAAPTSTSGFALCETCHATDFSGGVAQTSCFTCHGGSGPHPTSWITGSYTHTTTDTGNASVCAQCHTNGANSPIAPPSPPAAAGTAPGCFNSTLCHATPTCGSCHGIPPSGTVFPDVAGNHAPHISVNANIACSTCHLGAGSGTALHENGVVDVILDPTYNAKAGGATYNASTMSCSNVACHGGLTTPNWQTGTINVNTQCTACHVLGTGPGVPENNSYYSGQHNNSDMRGLACTVCHDTTKLAAVHFTSLTAAISEPTVSAALNSAINFNGTTCNPSAGGMTGCHGLQRW